MAYLNARKLDSLTDSQWAVCRGIGAGVRAWCAETGTPIPVVLVTLLVTAEAESTLNPAAVGDDGTGIGLYQWGIRPRALGQEALDLGFTRQQLVDPLASSWIILRMAARNPQWASVARGSVYAAVPWWTAVIERPADVYGESQRRRDRAASWLASPALLTASAAQLG